MPSTSGRRNTKVRRFVPTCTCFDVASKALPASTERPSSSSAAESIWVMRCDVNEPRSVSGDSAFATSRGFSATATPPSSAMTRPIFVRPGRRSSPDVRRQPQVSAVASYGVRPVLGRQVAVVLEAVADQVQDAGLGRRAGHDPGGLGEQPASRIREALLHLEQLGGAEQPGLAGGGT